MSRLISYVENGALAIGFTISDAPADALTAMLLLVWEEAAAVHSLYYRRLGSLVVHGTGCGSAEHARFHRLAFPVLQKLTAAAIPRARDFSAPALRNVFFFLGNTGASDDALLVALEAQLLKQSPHLT